jgi:hypothetical protein
MRPRTVAARHVERVRVELLQDPPDRRRVRRDRTNLQLVEILTAGVVGVLAPAAYERVPVSTAHALISSTDNTPWRTPRAARGSATADKASTSDSPAGPSTRARRP